MTKPMIIDGEEYLQEEDVAEILKSQNIKLTPIRKLKRSNKGYIKKVDVENLVTFYKESELLRKELSQKKALMMAQYKTERELTTNKIEELRKRYGFKLTDSIVIKEDEYIRSRLAAEILNISSRKVLYLCREGIIKNLKIKTIKWLLKSDVEEIKKEIDIRIRFEKLVEKLQEKYADKIQAYQKQKKQEDDEWSRQNRIREYRLRELGRFGN